MSSLPVSSTLHSGRTAEPWVSIDEVAAHLGVRKESVYRWIEQRGLPATKIGKLWKLRLSEVDAWLLARRSTHAAPAIVPAPTKKRATARHAAPKRVVLVIDDDELVRDTLTDFLGDEGFGVSVAPDGAVALELLATGTCAPCLIILDLKMPNLDGWQFLEEQARTPHLAAIPVVVVTAVPNEDLAVAAILPKPLRLGRLASVIESVLGSVLGSGAKSAAVA